MLFKVVLRKIPRSTTVVTAVLAREEGKKRRDEMILVVMPTLLWFGLGIIHQIFWTFPRRFLWFDGAGSVLISSRRFSRSMDGLRSMMKDRRQGWAGCQPGRVESIGSSESSELISSRGSTVIHISVCEQQKDSFSSLLKTAVVVVCSEQSKIVRNHPPPK